MNDNIIDLLFYFYCSQIAKYQNYGKIMEKIVTILFNGVCKKTLKILPNSTPPKKSGKQPTQPKSVWGIN